MYRKESDDRVCRQLFLHKARLAKSIIRHSISEWVQNYMLGYSPFRDIRVPGIEKART